MAGDWIKMRVDLQSHPKVVRILSATRSDKFRVIGGLHAVWTIFDTHSEDGKLKGYTPEALDHVIGWDGFSRAMEAVGWLVFDGLETLAMPEFDSHNGASAKRRAEDQKRKKTTRKSVRNLSAECADEMQTREEKRREDKELMPAKRGTRLPDDWKPSKDELQWAMTERTDIAVGAEVERFRDYWISQPGAKGVKLDWSATWRNWVRNARHVNGTAAPTPTKTRPFL